MNAFSDVLTNTADHIWQSIDFVLLLCGYLPAWHFAKKGRKLLAGICFIFAGLTVGWSELYIYYINHVIGLDAYSDNILYHVITYRAIMFVIVAIWVVQVEKVGSWLATIFVMPMMFLQVLMAAEALILAGEAGVLYNNESVIAAALHIAIIISVWSMGGRVPKDNNLHRDRSDHVLHRFRNLFRRNPA